MDVNTSVIKNSGVCTHSADNFWQDYAVFSVGDHGVNDGAFIAYCKDNNLPFKPLEGSYKGVKETSFIMPRKSYERALKDGWLVGQESVLLLSTPHSLGGGQSYRDATLLFLETGDTLALGHFVPRHKDYALAQEAWTFDPATGTYFVCVDDARAKRRPH